MQFPTVPTNSVQSPASQSEMAGGLSNRDLPNIIFGWSEQPSHAANVPSFKRTLDITYNGSNVSCVDELLRLKPAPFVFHEEASTDASSISCDESYAYSDSDDEMDDNDELSDREYALEMESIKSDREYFMALLEAHKQMQRQMEKYGISMHDPVAPAATAISEPTDTRFGLRVSDALADGMGKDPLSLSVDNNHVPVVGVPPVPSIFLSGVANEFPANNHNEEATVTSHMEVSTPNDPENFASVASAALTIRDSPRSIDRRRLSSENEPFVQPTSGTVRSQDQSELQWLTKETRM